MDTGTKRLWENNIVQDPRWLFKTVQRSGFAGWKAFAEESDPTLTKAKKGMTEQWAEAYTRWMLALRILEIIARHEKGDEELHVQAACKQSGFYSL